MIDLSRQVRTGEGYELALLAGGTGRVDGLTRGVIGEAYNESTSETVLRGMLVKQTARDAGPIGAVRMTTDVEDLVYGVALEDIGPQETGLVALFAFGITVLTTGDIGVGERLGPSATPGYARSLTTTGSTFGTSHGTSSGTGSVKANIRGSGAVSITDSEMCRPAVFSTFAAEESLGGVGSQSGTNHGAMAVAGPQAERVQLTLSRGAVPGQAIVVLASHTHGSNPAVGVWDDAGNTYAEAAYHRNSSGGDQPRVFIFYTNVTEELQAGDKITLEVNVGSSFLPENETGDRSLSVYLFSGAIANPVESGTGAAISGAPSVTVGAGGLLIAAVGIKGPPADSVSDDSDWTPFTPVANGGGSASNRLRGGFRIGDADGENWTGSISSARDWASVGAIFDIADVGEPNDGNPDLVGAIRRLPHCDHRHDVHRDTAPTVNDDWATAGYKVGTIWAQVDDLVTPTTIVGTWMLLDNGEGAAVWAPIGGGGMTNPMTTVGDLIRGGAAGAPTRVAIGTAGYSLRARTNPTWEADRATLNFVIDGGGAAIAAGVKGDIVIDFACEIESATLLADQSGDIVIDLWKDAYANFPPVDGDSITAAAPPTLSSAAKSQDSTLTGWTKSITAGDVLRVNVDSAATIERVTLALKLRRS